MLWSAGGCCRDPCLIHHIGVQHPLLGIRATCTGMLLHEGISSCLPAVLLLCAAAFAHAGAKLLWGGQPLTDHTIPKCYGAIQPTAVFVPLASMQDPAVFKLVTTEVFGPFQVISEFEGAVGTGRQLRRLSRQVWAAAQHI